MNSKDKQLIEVNENSWLKTKTKKVSKKIDSIVFNVKFLNIAYIILVVLFAIIFAITGVVASNKSLKLQNEYDKRLKLIELYNQNYINASVMGGSSSSTETKEEAMFGDAKEAVSYAFKRFYEYDSMEMSVYGVASSVAAGFNAELIIDILVCKYNTGTVFSQTIKNETKTNLGLGGAKQVVYKDGKAYTREGKKLKISDGNLSADFSGSFKEDTKTSFTEWPFYLINESTITSSKYLTVQRNAMGKIVKYYASVELSTTASVVDYAKLIAENGGTSVPTFDYIKLNCEIDRNGDLLNFSIDESMQLTKKIVINITAKSTDTSKYTIISHNESPSVAEPTV